MSSERGRGTALVVDDDPVTRAVLRHALEIDGWRVVEAENGRVALAFYEKAPTDVVITDIEMPELDGVELALRLRERRVDLPVLAVTRHPPPEADAFDGVLGKPVPIQALRSWLARY